jgi:hypothetical protein
VSMSMGDSSHIIPVAGPSLYEKGTTEEMKQAMYQQEFYNRLKMTEESDLLPEALFCAISALPSRVPSMG